MIYRCGSNDAVSPASPEKHWSVFNWQNFGVTKGKTVCHKTLIVRHAIWSSVRTDGSLKLCLLLKPKSIEATTWKCFQSLVIVCHQCKRFPMTNKGRWSSANCAWLSVEPWWLCRVLSKNVWDIRILPSAHASAVASTFLFPHPL